MLVSTMLEPCQCSVHLTPLTLGCQLDVKYLYLIVMADMHGGLMDVVEELEERHNRVCSTSIPIP